MPLLYCTWAVEFYGPQPTTKTTWRGLSRLRERTTYRLYKTKATLFSSTTDQRCTLVNTGTDYIDQLEKTALDRGRTDHISLTHDLDLDPRP